jgi:hypothetical protein
LHPLVADTPSVPAAAPREPQSAPLGPPSGLFLLRDVKAGHVLLVSSETGATRVIASAAGGLYQAELQLFWYRDGGLLKVLDLTDLDAAAVTVADGLPEIDRFSIIGQRITASPDDGCDELPSLDLMWTADPSIESPVESEAPPRITNREWLRHEIGRRPRRIGAQHALSDAREHLRVPKRLLACEMPDVCGGVLPLSGTGIQLVLIRQLAGGDCVHTACMLHDPKTKQFAKPPHSDTWGPADKSRLGSCGPYKFNSSNSAYLVDDQLCTTQGCKTLAGPALGWLEPGDVIGEPGVGAFGDVE